MPNWEAHYNSTRSYCDQTRLRAGNLHEGHGQARLYPVDPAQNGSLANPPGASRIDRLGPLLSVTRP